LDYNDIGRERFVYWDEDNLSLSLFRYKPGKIRTDKATQFVLCFKESGSACFSTACVYEALGKILEDWKREKREFDFRYVVPVPSHLAHEVSASSKLICGFISKMFPWLQYPGELLFREEDMPAAHLAYPGQRPTATEQFQ
jgi:hypothetical protein